MSHITWQPRQACAADAHVLHFFKRDCLGAGERLEHAWPDPRMLFDDGSADADQVHDREKASTLEIVFFGGAKVRPEPCDVGGALQEWGRGAGCDHGIEL